MARMGHRIGAYRVLSGRREGERPLGRPRRRFEDNIKKYIQDLGTKAWTELIWLMLETSDGHL